MYSTIYDFITAEKVAYTKEVKLEDGWNWSMKAHLRRCFLIKNSQFLEENENRYLRPNKNIVLAIANIAYRTEGFDVKDIELYVNNIDKNYKSLIVRKYHDKWALENEIDTFIDDMVVSYHDYGGTLVRDTSQGRPEVIDLRAISFCNQHDILSNPFGITHKMSFSDLRKAGKELGWGDTAKGATISIKDFIALLKKQDKKEAEVEEVHGWLPNEWLDDNTEMVDDTAEDTQQIQVVAYYKKENGDAQGVTLFKHAEPALPFKFLARDKIVDRALGRSGIEEQFESSAWTNWNEIKITEMLEGASRQINLTDDPAIISSHPTGLKNLENHEFVKVADGKKGIWTMDTTPRNLAVFNDAVERWQAHAQQLGSASEGMLGESPSSGTPFKLYKAQNILANGMHKYRQGQLAAFMDEIYRDFSLKHVSREIDNDKDFLSELSADEMLFVAKTVATKRYNKTTKEIILSGQLADPSIKDAFIQKEIDDYLGEGNKRFFSIVKGDFKDHPLDVRTNIAGKQKNLALMTDKVTNILRQFLITPQLRQDPEMIKLLNVVLESSGMSPIMFGATPPQIQQPQGTPQGTQQLTPTMATA